MRVPEHAGVFTINEKLFNNGAISYLKVLRSTL